MSGKFAQVVEANWDERVVFAESIPHLFHFDLLYLWMLERDPDRRSRAWRERIEGWRHLVSLFLLGELQVEEEAIRQPFLDFTRPFGVESVSWLKDRFGSERLGVMSPTVLVRPLPDFTASALERWREAHGDLGGREDEIRHFAGLAISQLADGEGGAQPTFRGRLARMLEREIGRGSLAHSPGGRHISVPVLRSLGWARPRLESEALDEVSLVVRDAKELQSRSFVPRCRVCNELLTGGRRDDAIEVRGPLFQVTCPKGHSNEILLAHFLIWYRNKGQVVVWADDSQVNVASPPRRTIQGNEIDLEWNPGRVGGVARRFLKLRFPGATVTEHSLSEIYFDKILIPGRLETFRGLPIRPEWIDVLQDAARTLPDVDPSAQKVVYRNLVLGGSPEPMTRTFGDQSLVVREDLALGLYPDPLRVGPEWRWFRAFLDGPSRGEHNLACLGADRLVPWISEAQEGIPQILWVDSLIEPGTGVTYVPLRPASGPVLSPARARVGVDFGTSNTLIGFYEIVRGGGRGQPVTLAPESLLDLVAWLAPPSDARPWEGTVGGFLPPRGYRSTAEDRHLIPSALWMLAHQQQIRHLIRWDSREPQQGAEAISGFKWDPEDGNLEGERHAFLREALLLSLPAILAQTTRMQTVTDVDLGFAFPLAFNFDSRSRMLGLLDRLGSSLQQITGLRFQFMHLNESYACVNAFGMFRQGETFLVADMGGGTIDLALFTMQVEGRTDVHQIGSLRFAGEHGVQALANKKGSTAPGDAAYWRIRDLIVQGQARELYGKDQNAQKVVERLVTFSFEYLRTMVAAFRRQHPGKPIRVVLVGNGWHLADALHDRARQRGVRRFFSEFYRHFLGLLGEPDLLLYDGDPLPGLPSSKHLVVRGALENTIERQQQELLESERLSRLPAGRSLVFKPPDRDPVRLGWDHILGEDESASLDVSRIDLRPEYLTIDVHDMPPLSSAWRQELLDAFQVRDESGIPYPNEPELRREIGRSMNMNRIGLGPLQLILEECWRKELSR